MSWLKQSTAVTLKIGPFVDENDGKTAETGLTVSRADVRLSKNGGNMAQKNEATSCTHDEIGVYDCPVDTTDTNTLGRLDLFVHESGALPVYHSFMVVPANVWDSLFGADALQVHANEITAGLITAAAIATGAIDADALAADAVAELADGVWDEALAGHTTAGSAGKAMSDAQDGDFVAGSATAATNAARGYQGLVLATAITGTLTTTAFTTDLTEATNDHYNGRTLTFTSGVLAGQMTTISDYNGTTKLVTVAAMTEAPGNGDAFFIA